MKKLVSIAIISLISAFFGAPAMAVGYVENLYLCDLGIMNSNSYNKLGVDYIHYFQNDKNLGVSASSRFSSALNNATNLDSHFDRWDPLTGINDVSINLESDFYGAEYYLEYCYTWDRTLPSDNLNYDIKFTTSLPSAVPSTQLSVDTNCSLKANNGVVANTSISDSAIVINTMTTDFSSMRCTIKLNFKEDIYLKTRPHNGDLVGVDPHITVKVTP
jgi:hypothetical protein